MTTLHLSPKMLDWAATQIDVSVEDLARQIVGASRVERFLQGEMTPRQAEDVAKKTHVPFGFLFLPSPPILNAPSIPDLRQLPNPEPLSPDFRELFTDILRKQQWYAEHIERSGRGPLAFVGRYAKRLKPSATEVAEDIRRTLGFSESDRAACGTHKDLTDLLTSLAEQAGILVFRASFVRSNTRQGLSVEEFRGFALADPIAPVIFINGADSPAAWVFTLAHELAHIWVGASGVSDLSLPRRGHSKGVEQRCNQIAAELLVPRETFLDAWHQATGDPIDELRRQFKVSRLVVARRALDLALIPYEVYQQEANASKQMPRPRDESKRGPTIYQTLPIRNSKRLTQALVRSVRSGETLLRDAGHLLNVSPDTVMELGRRMSANE